MCLLHTMFEYISSQSMCFFATSVLLHGLRQYANKLCYLSGAVMNIRVCICRYVYVQCISQYLSCSDTNPTTYTCTCIGICWKLLSNSQQDCMSVSCMLHTFLKYKDHYTSNVIVAAPM